MKFMEKMKQWSYNRSPQAAADRTRAAGGSEQQAKDASDAVRLRRRRARNARIGGITGAGN